MFLIHESILYSQLKYQIRVNKLIIITKTTEFLSLFINKFYNYFLFFFLEFVIKI
jgi:hypothetical protein